MAKILKIARAFTIIVVLLWNFSTKAQQRYQTREGIIAVIGSYRDSIVIASNDHLFVLLNYETADITLTLNPATLRTTTDSLNVILTNLSLMPVILKGKLNIPFVNTLEHPDQKLNFTAELHMNKIIKTIYANGQLKHIAGNETFSNLLTLNFKLLLSDFGIFLPEGWSDEITIQINQAMLKKQ
ncbi:hypothetical protein [Flavobacterium sp. K5-23]|uniref:hypothetical protein n=1 Tax=Flavobacterium sp. K5-23 TaxID=2746225 RepID=UPI00200C0A16|nr:hypothetical protein [Flavobacterium sp. K5-23]UQD55144.1 hypothetical protein FLAK523_01560 [Flavobacterium sp. K5-23]